MTERQNEFLFNMVKSCHVRLSFIEYMINILIVKQLK